MRQIMLAQHGDGSLDHQAALGMYRLRHEVFHDRLGWDVNSDNGLPASLSTPAIARVVWLLPEPVRTAQTETTGTVAVSIVARGPSRTKFAPAACTWLALCITDAWLTSE